MFSFSLNEKKDGKREGTLAVPIGVCGVVGIVMLQALIVLRLLFR